MEIFEYPEDNSPFLWVDLYGRLVCLDREDCMVFACDGLLVLDEYISGLEDIFWNICNQEKVTEKYIRLMFGL